MQVFDFYIDQVAPYSYGHELDYGFPPSRRAETCLHCHRVIKSNQVVFSAYKMRFSQGYQCGRWHSECIKEGIAKANLRKGYCWLTGEDGVKVRYMQTTKAQRFSGTEEALHEWVKQFKTCKSIYDRAEMRYRLRVRQVYAIVKRHIDSNHILYQNLVEQSSHWLKIAADDIDALGYAEFNQRWPHLKLAFQSLSRLIC